MKDIELQTEAFKRYIEECDELSITPDYAGAFNAAWKARAAVEADRAQRVPDVDALADKIAECLHGTYHCNRVWEAWHVGTMSQDDFEPVDESETPREIAEEIVALLASTPAQPAQQEPTFMRQFAAAKKEVEAIRNSPMGASVQEAVLVAQPAPQTVERKPMTDEEIERGRKETFSTENPFCPCDSKTMRKAVRWAERHHGIKE